MSAASAADAHDAEAGARLAGVRLRVRHRGGRQDRRAQRRLPGHQLAARHLLGEDYTLRGDVELRRRRAAGRAEGAVADPGGAGADGVAVDGRWRLSRGAARFSQVRGASPTRSRLMKHPLLFSAIFCATGVFTPARAQNARVRRRARRWRRSRCRPRSTACCATTSGAGRRATPPPWRRCSPRTGIVLQTGRNPIRGRAAIAKLQGTGRRTAAAPGAFAYATSDTTGYILGAYGYGEGANVPDREVHVTLRRSRGGPWKSSPTWTTGTGHRESSPARQTTPAPQGTPAPQ